MASWKDKLALTAQRNRLEIVKAKLNRREMMRLGPADHRRCPYREGGSQFPRLWSSPPCQPH
jgi:hypothetical protein